MTLETILGAAFWVVFFILVAISILTHTKWLLKVAIGLFLVVLVLGIIANPSSLSDLGWFIFAAVCFVAGSFFLKLIRDL